MVVNAVRVETYADDEARWQAVLDRDLAADGDFYYAVRSTGIYCRPTCPSRRPRRHVVAFFDEPEEAELAGFRPCRRCYPNQVSPRQQLVAQVQGLLDTLDPSPSLTELGRLVGFSPFHVQRVFKRATGLSPKQYAASRRAHRLKTELQNGASVTTAMYAAGYRSSRTLHENARQELGMNPSTYRSGGQGERIAYAVVDSPLGRMLVAATDKGLCTLKFGEEYPLVEELHSEFPRAKLVEDAAAVEPHTRAIVDHLEDRGDQLDLPLDMRGTGFQQRVWAALRDIPFGETRSYSELAKMIGQPTAVRAVARACATNPVALVVPCHRVVGSDGALHGYRWGMHRKRALLDRERAQIH